MNWQNFKGSTPLHFAVSGRHQKSTIQLLLESGANVNTADKQGVTPLMRAVRRSSVFLVEIESGTHGYDNTDRIDVEKAKCLEPVRLLLEAGARINNRDYQTRNALDTAFDYSPSQPDKYHSDLQMLLYAAGEKLEDQTVSQQDWRTDIPDFFRELRENLDLKHLCRETIRKHLIHVDPHTHLFGRIPTLGLPSLVNDYLLYDYSLDPI